MDADAMSLPCAHGRHPRCAGEFVHGVGRWLMRDDCSCWCHLRLDEELLDPRYGLRPRPVVALRTHP